MRKTTTMLSRKEHQATHRQAKRDRANGQREYRAAGGLVYTKHRPVVRVLTLQDERDPDSGEAMTVATSNASNEVGRFFRIWRGEGGRWRCGCACFSAIAACVHTGYLLRLDEGEGDDD